MDSANVSKIPCMRPATMSASGSPRHSAVSPAVGVGVGVSSFGSSRLPRRTQALAYKRSSLPVMSPTPPSSRNKPLPSPPVGQLVDPNSPPKAQRTLVDAYSASSPGEGWPAMQPENVSPKPDGQRSVSEGVPAQQIANVFVENGRPKTARAKDDHRRFSSNNPYGKSFDTLSTETQSAAASPLARKKSAPTKAIVPPRVSSKRNSLPLSTQDKVDARASAVSLRPRKPHAGTTKFPLLGGQTAGESAVKVNVTPVVPQQQCAEPTLTFTQAQDAHETETSVSPPTEMDPKAPSPQGSIKSDSSWSQAAGSSLDGEPEQDYAGSTRFKRLSWRSSGSGSGAGTGPVLKIYADADAVILGRRDSIPEVPAIPAEIPQRLPQPRSLSSLTGRISKHTMSRLSLINGSPSPTSSATDAGPSGSPGVKISPIRSMQPPRKASVGTSSGKPASPVTQTTTGPARASKLSLVSSANDQTAPDTLQKFTFPPAEPASSLPEVAESPSPASAPNEQLDDVPSHSLIAPDAETMLTASKVEKIPASLDKTSVSPESSSRPGSNASAFQPAFPRTAFVQDMARIYGPSKLRAAETAKSITIDSPLGHGTPQSRQSKFPRSTSVSPSSALENVSTDRVDVLHGKQPKEVTAKLLKAKQSFRNIFKRGNKALDTPEPAVPKQGFMSDTRSGLAKVLKDSKSLSKVNLSWKAESRSEARPSTAVGKFPVTLLPVPDIGPASTLAVPEAIAYSSTGMNTLSLMDAAGASVHRILGRAEILPRDSPERLRAVEIAECVVNVAQCSKNASVSAIEAKTHARNAEIFSERANMEVLRLKKLCEDADIDASTMKVIKGLIRNAGLGVVEDELRAGNSARN